MEEGTEADIPGQEFGLVVGEQAEFRFLGSTVRRDDPAGTVVEEWEQDSRGTEPGVDDARRRSRGPGGAGPPAHAR